MNETRRALPELTHEFALGRLGETGADLRVRTVPRDHPGP